VEHLATETWVDLEILAATQAAAVYQCVSDYASRRNGGGMTQREIADWLDLQRWHRAPDSVCIVTGRSDGGGHAVADEHHLAVFVQPADAIWALLLAETGYGAGWG
jgi:hypothetical protein